MFQHRGWKPLRRHARTMVPVYRHAHSHDVMIDPATPYRTQPAAAGPRD
jgi:hypothetical protein